MENRERRQMRSVSSEFQTREEDGALYIEGYFSVFNMNYELWPEQLKAWRLERFRIRWEAMFAH
ncbi:MAG: hypothetical protein V8Q39_05880 [Anaerovoracaceae bacterium]